MSAPGADRLGAADLLHAAVDRKLHPTTAPGKGIPMTAPSPKQPGPADPPHSRRHDHRPGRNAAMTAPSPAPPTSRAPADAQPDPTTAPAGNAAMTAPSPKQPAPPRTKAPHPPANSTTHLAGAPQ